MTGSTGRFVEGSGLEDCGWMCSRLIDMDVDAVVETAAGAKRRSPAADSIARGRC